MPELRIIDVNTDLPLDINLQRDAPPDARFLATIRKHGVVIPILCEELPNKTLKLLAGRERVWGARIVSVNPLFVHWANVRAMIYSADEMTDELRAELPVLENRARSDNALTDVVFTRKLMRLGLDAVTISNSTGLHSATLKALSKYDKLLPDFEDAWLFLGAIMTPIADQLTRCTEDEQKALYATYRAQGNKLALAAVTAVLDARPKAAATIKVDKKATWQEVVLAGLEALAAEIPPEWRLDKTVQKAWSAVELVIRASLTRAANPSTTKK